MLQIFPHDQTFGSLDRTDLGLINNDSFFAGVVFCSESVVLHFAPIGNKNAGLKNSSNLILLNLISQLLNAGYWPSGF